jgi:DNA repair exonuclease SbcCD ATPase subunit
MIKLIKLNNFELFKSAEFKPEKINVISGVNLDDTQSSSNGSGKTTLAKNAITFCLYGDVAGINLKDLIRIGEKELYVTVQLVVGNDTITCIRRQPSELTILVNGNELAGNTAGIKQQFINEHFGDYEFFKKFRMIDSKGINLLDLGITSLRKELMNFVDTMFTGIRKNLLSKKLDRETYNLDKRYYKFSLSERRIEILNAGLDEIKKNYTEFEKDGDLQNGIANKLKTEIQTRERLINNRKYELQEAQKSGICPILKTKCSQITKEISQEQKDKMNQEVEQLNHEIEQYKLQLNSELEALEYYSDTLSKLQSEEQKARECLLKLKEAFKFKDYKYTAKDVLLYAEAIKVLDSFSGYYINEWLKQLAIIINDLLKNVNMQVEFNPEKDFIKIKNGENELKYEQLSSGQKCFLSSVFKLAILLHKGENQGIIIADEGLGAMDTVNFLKFIEICKTLPYQYFIIYQNLPELEGINRIDIVRQNGESKIK